MNSTLFLTGFGVYVCFLIWLGWFVSRNQKSGEDFLLGGRGLPLFLVLGTTVATMVGTGSSMGAVGFGYANGWQVRFTASAVQSVFYFSHYGSLQFVR
ncbi:sodium-solute symporter, putative [Vibrio ishigakensis]|uniref:Sodium-solute symporter, putative n=1 Tax=Vibrio ishigakensis TaxID=1481914 RepID=A0A0B8NS78_9VIBR|nr:sodium-solute symporter, putative [Vibrio ishigakensis]